jgi:hypothetical protein
MVTRSWWGTRANGMLQLSDPSVVDKIIEIVHQSKKK